MPPVSVSLSVLNCGADPTELPDLLIAAVGNEKLGVLGRLGGRASGHIVISVTNFTVWKPAKDIMDEVLPGPAWKIRSGFGRLKELLWDESW
jgi:hypothetical protein